MNKAYHKILGDCYPLCILSATDSFWCFTKIYWIYFEDIFQTVFVGIDCRIKMFKWRMLKLPFSHISVWQPWARVTAITSLKNVCPTSELKMLTQVSIPCKSTVQDRMWPCYRLERWLKLQKSPEELFWTLLQSVSQAVMMNSLGRLAGGEDVPVSFTLLFPPALAVLCDLAFHTGKSPARTSVILFMQGAWCKAVLEK